MKDISHIIYDLNQISKSPVVYDGFGVGFSLSENNFIYQWYLNNVKNHFSNYSVCVSSPDDAYKIISVFSGTDVESVKKQILHYNAFDASKPLFLHFVKTIKHV